MAGSDTRGAIPTLATQDNSQALHVPPPSPPRPDNRPATWQVVGGFLASVALMLGFLMWLGDRTYVEKETYHRDQKIQIETQTKLKAAVDANTRAADEFKAATKELRKSVDAHAATYDKINDKLDRALRRRRR